MKAFVVAVAAAAVFLGACGEFAVPDSAAVPDNPTWENSVRDVLANHCTRCHNAAGDRGAPAIDLTDYATASLYAGRLAGIVTEGEMPPAAPLGPNDTDILTRWSANGAPERE